MWHWYVVLVLNLTGALVAAGPTVTVKNGTLEGVHSPEYDQDFFLGIPYAQPPVGDLRFRNARPINTTWDGVKAAGAYSSACVGYGSDQFYYPVSEDCLYLNVIRPSWVVNEGGLPVAVWIHGGGFYMGSGVDQRYNMSFMIQNGDMIGESFIGVSINYRLSAWGFLNGQEVQDSGNTNLGLRDQRLALQWVQENIGLFGGDPSKVTIFGESAGAVSVGMHLVAYGGRDDKLFRGAIMQSGSPVHYASLTDSSKSEPRYQSFLGATNCSDLACLRALPYEALNSAMNRTEFITWGPAIDHDLIQGPTSTQLLNGQFVKVPIIAGATSDEGTAFSPPNINTEADLITALQAFPLPPSFIPRLLTAYPNLPSLGIPALSDTDNSTTTTTAPPQPVIRFTTPAAPLSPQYRRSAAIHGDAFFIASRRLTCAAWSTHATSTPAYSYRFNARPHGVAPSAGATHFQDVAFAFLNLLGVGYNEPLYAKPFVQGMGAGYERLARGMAGMWARFVVRGDPNGDGVEWPRYDIWDPRGLVLGAEGGWFAEMDTWRAEGITLINANAATVFGR